MANDAIVLFSWCLGYVLGHKIAYSEDMGNLVDKPEANWLPLVSYADDTQLMKTRRGTSRRQSSTRCSAAWASEISASTSTQLFPSRLMSQKLFRLFLDPTTAPEHP